MLRTIRKVTALLGVAGLVLLLLPATPAHATHGWSIAAVASGSTSPGPAPCTDPCQPSTSAGAFTGVALGGHFTVAGATFDGIVAVPGAGTVPFTTSQTLLFGTGEIGPATFTGTELGAFGSECLDGAILDSASSPDGEDGKFVRVGTVAIVNIPLAWDIGPLCDGAATAATFGRATFVGKAVPVPPTFATAVVAGPIAGVA